VWPSAILEFHVSTSWPWPPDISLWSGPKCSYLHPCRLTGQIDWHASPLCLQIHFCINTYPMIHRLIWYGIKCLVLLRC
jgi:hypothetical protein